jgi:hypothetical protein
MNTVVIFLGIKRPGRDVDHLPATIVEVRMSGDIPLLPLRGVGRDNFVYVHISIRCINRSQTVQCLSHDAVLSEWV